MQNDRVYALGATRVVIGLSALVKITPFDNQNGGMAKILSGGGTLEIVARPVALSGSSAIGWGLGYPIGANETINYLGPAVFYLAATGATMTLALSPAFSSGVTLSV